MNVSPLAHDQRRSDHHEGFAAELITSMEALTLTAEHTTIETLLLDGKSRIRDVAWAVYGVGETIYLLGQGSAQPLTDWPASVTGDQLDALCRTQRLHRWPYLALYDPGTSKITYPYYVDITDVDALEPEAHEYVDPAQISMTGYVLTSGQPLFVDAADIECASQQEKFFCLGHRPEFWMGAPLKNASDEVFGMLAMQVYDVSRVYSVEDRVLFQAVARHVAMALDRILHRADLERTVLLRTQELSALNAALRQEVLERERAEHLQSALFQIAELSSQPGDMAELFHSLHLIVGELLVALNFYIALYNTSTAEVTFPYYVDERQTKRPLPRRCQRGVTEYVIRHRRACLIDSDDALHLEAIGEIEISNEDNRSSSWLGVPLFEGDDVRGVLAVQSYSPLVSYSLRDQELLTFVSRHIDTALSRRNAAEAVHTDNLRLRPGFVTGPANLTRSTPGCSTKTPTTR